MVYFLLADRYFKFDSGRRSRIILHRDNRKGSTRDLRVQLSIKQAKRLAKCVVLGKSRFISLVVSLEGTSKRGSTWNHLCWPPSKTDIGSCLSTTERKAP